MSTLNPKNFKKSNNKQFWGRLHFGKTQNLGSVNTFAGRNNVHSRIIAHKTIWVQWASLFWVYFASTKFAQETLAMQHMPNIGMFETKTPLRETSRRVFFLEFNTLPNRTHGQSLDVGTFFIGRMLVFPSTARVTLIGGSPHLVSSLQPPFISYLGHLEGEQPQSGDLLSKASC